MNETITILVYIVLTAVVVGFYMQTWHKSAMLHAKIEALQEHKKQNGNDQRIFELQQRTIKSLEESNDRKDKKIAELEEWITIHWPLILNAGVMIKDLPTTVRSNSSLATLRRGRKGAV